MVFQLTISFHSRLGILRALTAHVTPHNFTALSNPASSSSSSTLLVPYLFARFKISKAFSINSHCCLAYLDVLGNARIFFNLCSNAYFRLASSTVSQRPALFSSSSPSSPSTPPRRFGNNSPTLILSSSSSDANVRIALARDAPFKVRERSSNELFLRPTTTRFRDAAADACRPFGPLCPRVDVVARFRFFARSIATARATRSASSASNETTIFVERQTMTPAASSRGAPRPRVAAAKSPAPRRNEEAHRRARRSVVVVARRRRLRASLRDDDDASVMEGITTTNADADADADLTRALSDARASAAAGFSPGAGLGLTPEEQAEAAYADLVDTSLWGDEEGENDVEALSRAGRMSAESMERKSGGVLSGAVELFRALSGGAHITRSSEEKRSRRD